MAGTPDRSQWHSLTLKIPFPSTNNATLVKRVVEVDKPLRPNELTRELAVDGSVLLCEFRAATVAQARVALDHFLSDVELVVQTMHSFGPPEVVGERSAKGGPDAPSLEVGLMGTWEVSHAHPPLRPAASEFDTPVLKRERSPEPATTSKKAVRASSPSSVKVVPASPDASTSPGKRAQPAAQNSLLDTRIAALTACGALDDVVAGPCSGKDDTGSLNLTASESLPASSVPTSLGGGGADPTGSSNGPSEVKPATLLRPKPIRSLAQPTPPNQRLRLGALKCRIPPPPPPFPSSIAALTIPYLLSRSPRTVLVRPHSRFSRTSRAASPELGNPAAPSAASGSRPRARISLAASSEGYWRNLLPHLSDQPHVGDDMATHNEALNERVWKAGLEPESLRFRDVEPDLADRLFPPPVFVTGASAQMLRNATLPDPYDRREMDRQDALAAQQRDARQTHRAARRAARAVAGKRPPGDARASDDDGMAEARRRRKKLRPSLRHETEGQLQARLRQLERIDEEPDDESTDEDEDGAVPQPTVGFRALALQTQKALRAKRLMRRAMGLDPDSETDDEDGGTGSVDAMKE
ncbi:hypothetical protein JCM3770_002207 [Rhodotorula araucariae]